MKPRRWVRALVGGIALVVAGALAHTWIRLRALDLGYAIAAESRRLDDLVQAERRLRVEVAYLKSPARIEREAQRFGMRVPDPDAIRRVRLRKRAAPRGGGE
jgi:cell division protein FtsL